jgi:regulator of RNase E activity RraA
MTVADGASDADAIRERFLQLDSATISDGLDSLGLEACGLAPGFAAVSGQRLAGWAYTIHGAPLSSDPRGGDAAKMAACEGVRANEVTVWAGGGTGSCYFGELIGLGLLQRGCRGAVVDGGVRDIRALAQHGLPTFARYTSSVQSIGRWKVREWQVPIQLGGAVATWVSVSPGDFILGDSDGVVVVPQALVREVLECAESLAAKEAILRGEILVGLPLGQALEKYGHV